jgi:hypothetical protein
MQYAFLSSSEFGRAIEIDNLSLSLIALIFFEHQLDLLGQLRRIFVLVCGHGLWNRRIEHLFFGA